MHEEIREQFDELGLEVPDVVLDKCVELCLTYKIDPGEFVEQWMAYSLSNLGGAEPEVQYLLDMERKTLSNKKEIAASAKKKKAQKVDLTQFSESNTLALYGHPTDTVNEEDVDEIMDSYNCKTPRAPRATLARTPARQNDSLFNPVSYSPLSGTPKSQSENFGKIVYTFGNSTLVKQAVWTSENKETITLKQISSHNNEFMNSNTKYMFDNLSEKSIILEDHLFNTGKELCKKVFGENATDYEIENVDVTSQDVVKIVGRICCDFDGKLDPASAILIGADEMKCRTARLNFSKTKSFGIFPGQIVMVAGANPRGDTIFVEEVLAERILTLPIPPKITNEISFLIASGPYTHFDDLVYDPLHDLVSYCKDHKPDVLIMTGPFVEADHNLVTSNILAETFESFFEKMLQGIVEAVGDKTTICIVSSHKDAISNMVYPTHPITTKKSYPNVHMLPDPCVIDVNGISLGITSTDIIDHLMTEELSVNAGDKIKRIVNYLFHQQSFYPITPPAIEMCFDSCLANKFAKLEIIPNIMILPSTQKCFIRDVNNCLAINPGKLSDKKGGTFARLIVYPPKEETNSFNYMACQVMRV